MTNFTTVVKKFIADEDGVTTIEYVLLAGALAAGIYLAFSNAGALLGNKFGAIVNNIQ